jgi:ribonuclease BN (tRNA processing enzyme)
VDGSEQSGPPTLFLSVQKDDVIKANYALVGLGDLLCRAAADQRYKLQQVRAVFVDQTVALMSLPSLLDVLYQAGREQVTVVSSSQRVESLIRIIHPYKQHPVVRTCQVPPETNCWWKIYQDEYILVHATRRSDQVLYLYTLLRWKETKSSFLALPSALLPHLRDLLQDLPLQDSRPLEVCAVIFIFEMEDVMLDALPWVPEHIPYYIVAPTSNNLLVRAQRLSQFFHDMNPILFPLRLPAVGISSRQLPTGTSLIFSSRDEHKMVNRMEDIWRETIRPERQRWMEGLLSFAAEPTADENEISLDDDDDETEDTTTLRLLVLGTGCAAPSPYRGASGYALLFPNDCSVVLEAGEGFVTQWHRYADGRSVNTIRLIWISHAHLDHYGGLVHLLKCIHASKTNHEPPKNKRRKLPCPYVVAGKKVLQYLLHMFDAPDEYYCGVEQSDIQQTRIIYESIPAIAFWEDVRVDHSCHQAYGMVAGFCGRTKNDIYLFCFSGDTTPCIRLTRSCQAHMKRMAKEGIDFLLHEATFGDSEHEKQMASSKKHSTFKGALLVATDINAKKTLLTHFSQRYESTPVLDDSGGKVVGLATDGLLLKLQRGKLGSHASLKGL